MVEGQGKKAVAPESYDAHYFLRACGGADWLERFLGSGGEEAYPHYRRLIERLHVATGHRVLDLGCGRGEVAALLAKAGAEAFGLDYSAAALGIARQVEAMCRGRVAGRMVLVQADATIFPFAGEAFDRIVMADVVEHLHDWQLDRVYRECLRVLRPGGLLLVHTWPNRWHTETTYPIAARLTRLVGSKRSLNPRKPHDEIVHINEQSLPGLRRHVYRSGLEVLRTWCEHDAPFAWRPDRWLYWFLHRAPGVRLLFADHLWLLARKGPR
jgi:SAM-dependent methyltransferase